MWNPNEAQEFNGAVAEIKSCLSTMCDEDARMAVGMLVSRVLEVNGAMTPEAADLVDEYKKLKPHLAARMDAFIASGGTTEP